MDKARTIPASDPHVTSAGKLSTRALIIFVVLFFATSASAQVGPQATITCPVGSVDIEPGQYIQSFVDLWPVNTTFCLRSGVHGLTSAITPKTGDLFIGEYGAVLDGTGWTSTDATQAAFRAANVNIRQVTIQNLVIRHFPQKAIYANSSPGYAFAASWTVVHNEITANLVGVTVPDYSLVQDNYIHHNVGDLTSQDYSKQGGGYQLYQSTGVTFDRNEIAYNGTNQKVSGSPSTTFRNNVVHHNYGTAGIWHDGENPNCLVENNLVEDNAVTGIFVEVNPGCVIRNNIVRRSGDQGIFVSNASRNDIYGNTLEDNWRGIAFFISCDRTTAEGPTHDLFDNTAHDNSIRVGTRSGSLANYLSYTGCTATQLAAYTNGAKNLRFVHNAYTVPQPAASYWIWGAASKDWTGWQGIPQDATGTLNGTGTSDPPPQPPPTTCTLAPLTETVRNKFANSEVTRLQTLGYLVTTKQVKGGSTTITAVCP